MTSPYHPRHRRPRGAHGRSGRSGRSSRLPSPSDILLAAMTLTLLLLTGFAAGGLMAHPF